MGNNSQILKMKEAYGEVYTKKQLQNKYDIESEAYGGVLCTNKETGYMTIFTKINVDNNVYYCKIGM